MKEVSSLVLEESNLVRGQEVSSLAVEIELESWGITKQNRSSLMLLSIVNLLVSNDRGTPQ